MYGTDCCLVVELTRPGVPKDPERAFKGLLRLPGKLPRGKGRQQGSGGCGAAQAAPGVLRRELRAFPREEATVSWGAFLGL